MSAAFQRLTFNPGEIVFCEGDPGDSMYVVEKGQVRIWRGSSERPVLIGFVDEGGIFGEMAIFDRKPRLAHASAETGATVMRMPATVLRESLYGADPMIVQLVQILINHVRSMARRIDELEGRFDGAPPPPNLAGAVPPAAAHRNGHSPAL